MLFQPCFSVKEREIELLLNEDKEIESNSLWMVFQFS